MSYASRAASRPSVPTMQPASMAMSADLRWGIGGLHTSYGSHGGALGQLLSIPFVLHGNENDDEEDDENETTILSVLNKLTEPTDL